MTPEEQARQHINKLLPASGWCVQAKDSVSLSTQPGVAVCEISFKTGEPGCTLFVDGKAIGPVETKPKGHSLKRVLNCSAVGVEIVERSAGSSF